MINVVILGATGSIGLNSLEVIRRHPDRLKLLGVAANRNRNALDNIATEFRVHHQSLFSEDGLDGLMRLSTLPEADVIVLATTGTIGLKPCLAALAAGKTVALASKEVLVLAGRFVMDALRTSQGRLLPIDSEHNALFQCMEALARPEQLKRILLTASGGPFRDTPRSKLANVTVEDALKHPNWEMGRKITIDSATMANKGLEMLEARWLFDLAPNQIEALIHPQSIIHSMIECIDGSVLAQLAPPSMTFPIQHCLLHPDRAAPPAKTLDFSQVLSLELRPVDFTQFPCLRLAKTALQGNETAPAVYNAANEVAVAAFLDRKIPFLAIPELIEATFANAEFPAPSSVDDIVEIEAAALRTAQIALDKLKK